MEQKGKPPSVHSNAETEHELEANNPDLILEAHQSIGGHELDLCKIDILLRYLSLTAVNRPLQAAFDQQPNNES